MCGEAPRDAATALKALPVTAQPQRFFMHGKFSIFMHRACCSYCVVQLCGCKHLHASYLAPAPGPMSPPAEQVPAVPVNCSILEQSVIWQFDPCQEASIWSCEFGNGFSPRTRECDSLQILLQGLTGLMGI